MLRGTHRALLEESLLRIAQIRIGVRHHAGTVLLHLWTENHFATVRSDGSCLSTGAARKVPRACGLEVIAYHRRRLDGVRGQGGVGSRQGHRREQGTDCRRRLQRHLRRLLHARLAKASRRRIQLERAGGSDAGGEDQGADGHLSGCVSDRRLARWVPSKVI